MNFVDSRLEMVRSDQSHLDRQCPKNGLSHIRNNNNREESQPYFSQPVKVSPDHDDATANKIREVLGDYDYLKPYVQNQSMALLGVSTGAPNTPKLDKPYQKHAPSFFQHNASHKNGELNPHAKNSKKTVDRHLSPTCLKAESSRTESFDIKANSSTMHGSRTTNINNSNPPTSSSQRHIRKPDKPTQLYDSKIKTSKSKYSSSDLKESPVSSEILHKNSSKTCANTKKLANDIQSLPTSIKSEQFPTPINIPKIVLPSDNPSETIQNVDDIIKEMTASKTPLTGIQTPSTDHKFFSPPTNHSALSSHHRSADSKGTRNSKRDSNQFLQVKSKCTSPSKSNLPTKFISSKINKELKNENVQKDKKHKSERLKQKVRLSSSDSSSNDSDSESESNNSASSSDEDTRRDGHSRSHTLNSAGVKNNTTNTPVPSEFAEQSWSLSNFLPDKSNSQPANQNAVTPISNLSPKTSAQQQVNDSEDEGYDLDFSDDDDDDGDDDRGKGQVESIKNMPSSQKVVPHRHHHRVANKSPHNYDKNNTNNPSISAEESPSKHSNVKVAYKESKLSNTQKQLPDKKSTSKNYKVQVAHLSESSNDSEDEINECFVDVEGITPEKSNVVNSDSTFHQSTSARKKVEFDSDKTPKKLHRSIKEEQSPRGRHDVSTTISPYRKNDVTTKSSSEQRQNKVSHRSRDILSHSSSDKDSSLERFLKSAKTERHLSPIVDENWSGTVSYNDDGRAAVLVKLDLSLLEHVPVKDKESNLNVNLISPDSGISVNSNNGITSNNSLSVASHVSSADIVASKDDGKPDVVASHSSPRHITETTNPKTKPISPYHKKADGPRNALTPVKSSVSNDHIKSQSDKSHKSDFDSRRKDDRKRSHKSSKSSHKESSHRDGHKRKRKRSASRESSWTERKDDPHASTRTDEGSRAKYAKYTSKSSNIKEHHDTSAPQSSQKLTSVSAKSYKTKGEGKEDGREDSSVSCSTSSSLTCQSVNSVKETSTAQSDSHLSQDKSTHPVQKNKESVNKLTTFRPLDNGENWHLDRRRLLMADEYLADAKRLKHAADVLTDRHVKSLTYTEAVLCFILCGYAMERENLSETARIFSMYKDTLRLIMSINNRFRNNQQSSDLSGKDKKLTVLSLRIQSLLSLKLYTLKKSDSLKLKKQIDDYYKNGGSQSQRSVAAPSPAQPGLAGRSTGTPSPLSPTHSPAGSIGSVGSQGSSSDASALNKLAASGPGLVNTPGSSASGIVTLPGTVSVPQRIYSMIQQYMTYMHFLVQCHELWEQADIMANHCHDFFPQVDESMGPLTLNSDIWDLVQYIRQGLILLKQS